MVFLLLLVRGRGVERSCMSTTVCTAGFNQEGFMIMGTSLRIGDCLEEIGSTKEKKKKNHLC